MNLNKVFVIGNLTRDPEMRSTSSGQPVVSFGLATNRMWKGQDGSQQKQTEFHNIVMFGKLAEITKQYLQKGSLAMIEGRLQTRSWDSKDGQKKYRTEIVAERMQMGPKGAHNKPADSPEGNQAGPPSSKGSGGEELATVEYPEDEIKPDDIPF
jgi:single-strand DNA-binding protein